MPKNNINNILKPGVSRKVDVIDYSTGSKQKELKELKEKRDAVLRSKDVDWQRLSSFIISK